MLVVPGKQLLHAMATVSKELLFIMSHPCLGISDKPSLQTQQGEAHKEGKSFVWSCQRGTYYLWDYKPIFPPLDFCLFPCGFSYKLWFFGWSLTRPV